MLLFATIAVVWATTTVSTLLGRLRPREEYFHRPARLFSLCVLLRALSAEIHTRMTVKVALRLDMTSNVDERLLVLKKVNQVNTFVSRGILEGKYIWGSEMKVEERGVSPTVGSGILDKLVEINME